MRLDKYVSSQEDLSRTDVKKLIKQGLIVVSGTVANDPSMQVDPNKDIVSLNGQDISYKEHIYIMLNKPKGVVSATEDKKQTTVVDLVPNEMFREGLFPAGRLDGDTEGFVLLTDDGDFAHRILSPKNHINKTYIATLADEISDKDISRLEAGITLKDGYECLPAKIIMKEPKVAKIIICEGKYHQIKRMFAACGNKVTSLTRVKMGNLELDSSLNLGECREITKDELDLIYKTD